ncbi:hypothetical protein [Reyranella sp. CPCC 100927]|uniref:hypothetical protein n=1 Tax=Reyranella sp. CPCC 100927 TaxID=2599616 RepID=UPI0011B7F1C2|nr:hypothetical protein [Reyranella sp. CPCC 100927]TWS95109.1 hypothetical protein FQU96_40420 [Reyranella sp. CPCC 100927]
MMKKKALAAYIPVTLACLPACSITSAQAQLPAIPSISNWIDYRASDGSFAIRFPGTVQVRPWREGALPATHYLTGTPDEVYSVTVIPLPQSTRGGRSAADVAREFTARSLAVMEPNGVDFDRTEACFSGTPGRRVQASVPVNLHYVARICTTTTAVYRAEVVVSRQRWTTARPRVDAFLESFRPTERVAQR